MIFTTFFLITFFPWGAFARRCSRAPVTAHITPIEHPRQRDNTVSIAEWRLNDFGGSHLHRRSLGTRIDHSRRLVRLKDVGQRVEVITVGPGMQLTVVGVPGQVTTPTPTLTHAITTSSVPSHPTSPTSKVSEPQTNTIPTSSQTTQTSPSGAPSTGNSESQSFSGGGMNTPAMNNAELTGGGGGALFTMGGAGTPDATEIPGSAGIPTPTNPSNTPGTNSQPGSQFSSSRLANSESRSIENQAQSSQTTSSDSSHQTAWMGSSSNNHSSAEGNRIIIIIGCLILGALVLGGMLALIWRWRRKNKSFPKEPVIMQAHAFNVVPSEASTPRKFSELPAIITLPSNRPSLSTVSDYHTSEYQVHTQSPLWLNSPGTDPGHHTLNNIRDRLHHIRGLVSAGDNDEASVLEINRMIDELDFRPPDYASLHSGRGSSSYYVVGHGG